VLSRDTQPEGPTPVERSAGVLHQLFERQASATPEAIAVLCGCNQITYAQLERRSNQIARLLRARGVGRGTCVGILLPRSDQVYAVLLGVLKTGAAYVPLDPEYPANRVGFILEDCAAVLLITSEALANRTAEFAGVRFVMEAIEREILSQSTQPLDHWATGVSPEDLCYVIYTSGTTGRPKGVQIEHRSATHFAQTERDLFKLCPTDRVFQGFSLAFDASVEEIWLAFCSGAALVVGTTEIMRSGDGLSRCLADAGVSVLSCVPTLLAMMEENIPTLRLLILGGEVCPPELVKRWWRPDCRIVNTYGPTEATVVATYAECHPGRPVTIGRPLSGYTAHIFNENLEPVASGEVGELLLGGLALARGYLGKPQLTEEKFILRCFDGGPVQRLYRTGDLVRWSGNQELEFLGRIDTQVKLRGFRVELSEIESVLLECPGVKAAAVTLFQNSLQIEQLAGFVVPRTGSALDLDTLRKHLKSRLPAYMIPGSIEMLSELPLLPSGKVDRKALPVGEASSGAVKLESAEPVTELERQILEAWAGMFSTPTVGKTDDFFLDLGGHSLLAARMVSELRRSPCFSTLSMADIYRYPTAARLARELKSRGQPRLGSIPFDALDDSGGEKRGHNLFSDGDPASNASRSTTKADASAGTPFWRHFVCGTAQLFALTFVLSFFALQWLAPYLTYTVLVEEEYDFLTSVLGAFASLVLVYPLMLMVVIALKWLIIGRYKPGEYPLWGFYYFRFWLVTSIEGTVPVTYLSGTPLLNIFLRLMGAKIGRNVFVQTDNFAIYDLVSIGEGSSINSDASLLGYSVSGGKLKIGHVRVGRRCLIGTRAMLAADTSMEDDSVLEDLSLLASGQSIGAGETWLGSPARLLQVGEQNGAEEKSATSADNQDPSRARRAAFAIAHAAGLFLFPILVVSALFPGIVVMNHLNYIDPYYWYLFLSPLVAVSFVGLLCLEIVALKWLLLGRVRAGRHRLHSWYYLRKWFVDKTMELSLDVVGPLYASVYLTPWYKMLGAKLGYGTEISTASFISPDLLSIGSESFIADNASLGAPRVQNGVIRIGPNHIGKRAFIGNSALLPPGAVIGDDVLIGCLSTAPQRCEEALRQDSSWLGSPALFLRQRLKNSTFSDEATFHPTARLRVLRATIEFIRVITPSTGFIILTSLLFSALLLLHDYFSLFDTLLFFPALYLGAGMAASGFTIFVKWMLVGRYRPGEQPLWSTFVWRNELINAVHDHLACPFLVAALTGTPFICWYFRLLGAQIGRRVYLETTDFSEFDLALIGDDAALNTDCTVQTHLFEDRVMKMSRIEIGPRCSVGANSLVLYDTRMEPGSTLGPLSLLMKGEVLPADTGWAGIPARAISPRNGH